jgi:hypothetical protein
MAETPLAQEEVADATYCTVELTWLPLAGVETETLANDRAPELSASKKATFLMGGNFLINCAPVVKNKEPIKASTGFSGWINPKSTKLEGSPQGHCEERLLEGARPKDYGPKFPLILLNLEVFPYISHRDTAFSSPYTSLGLNFSSE